MTTKRQQVQRLEQLAHAAHAQGLGGTAFVESVRGELMEIEPYDRNRWHQLRNRLCHIVLTGDSGGMFPPGDPDSLDPWILDDVEPSDVETNARLKLANPSGIGQRSLARPPAAVAGLGDDLRPAPPRWNDYALRGKRNHIACPTELGVQSVTE